MTSNRSIASTAGPPQKTQRMTTAKEQTTTPTMTATGDTGHQDK